MKKSMSMMKIQEENKLNFKGDPYMNHSEH